jgi:sulfite reductase alpha subunit-like flavoprotein
MAIFGLGDSRYQHFCGAAVVLQKFVAAAGASLVAEPLYLDGYPQRQVAVLQDWATHVRQCWRERRVLAEG